MSGTGSTPISGGARSAVVVPLGFRGRARGVLVALDRVNEGAAFDADDEHLLASFAASAAIAIATAQSVGADRLRHSLARVGGGARPLGARAARRDAPGARRAQVAARLGAPDLGGRARSRGDGAGARADRALDSQPPGADHRAAPRGARPDRAGARARRAAREGGRDQRHRRRGRHRHDAAGGQLTHAAGPGGGGDALPARPGVAHQRREARLGRARSRSCWRWPATTSS